MNPICGLCGGDEFEVLGDLGVLTWLRCVACHTEFPIHQPKEEDYTTLAAEGPEGQLQTVLQYRHIDISSR